MDRDASASGDESNDLIPRHRRAASCKVYGDVMNASYRDRGSAVCDLLSGSILFHLLQDLFIRKMRLVVFFKQLSELVDDLSFLESSVADRRHQGVPLTEAVLFKHCVLVLRLHDIRRYDGMCLAVSGKQFFAAYNILFFLILLEPLVDFVLGGCALTDREPVQGRTAGILGSDDFYEIAVLDLIVDIDELAVYSGSNHFVADGGVD